MRSWRPKIGGIFFTAMLLAGMAQASDHVPGPVSGTRRLAVILMQPDYPTAPEAEQYVTTQVNPNAAIPGFFGLTVSEAAYSGYGCRDLAGIRVSGLSIQHPRAADLKVQLSTLGSNGQVLKTQTIFDGPAAAKDKTQQQIAAIRIDDSYDANDLLQSSSCDSFRLVVIDTVQQRQGTLVSWTLGLRTAVYPFAHDAAYYDRLFFGGDGAGRNIADFFKEESRGKFTYTSAGVYGPVAWTNWRSAFEPGKGDANQVQDALALLNGQVNLSLFNANGDGGITNEELTIVAINPFGTVGGANRGGALGACTYITGVPGDPLYCGQIVLIPQQADFATIAHELTHQLGCDDMYYDGNPSGGLTLMSATITYPDDPHTLYLDAWNRFKLGWLGAYPWNSEKTYELGAEGWRSASDQPSIALKLNNTKNLGEYLLFEYRLQQGYDANVAGNGIVIWRGADQLKDTNDDVYAIRPAGGAAWDENNGRFRLKWKDGSLVPYVFWIEFTGARSWGLILHIEDAPVEYRPPVIDILRPADNSSGLLGFGHQVAFEARVVDPQTGTNDLVIEWNSDKDPPMGFGPLVNYAFVTPGTRKITVTAKNKYGLTASKSINYTATAGAPTVTIFSPASNATLAPNQPFRLAGSASNGVSLTVDCKRLWWSFDALPLWTAGGGNYENGQCVNTVSLNVTGPVVMTLHATDEFGQSASASVSVTFTQPAVTSPPLVSITAPGPNAVFAYASTYTFQGVVTDPSNSGPVQYRWAIYDPSTKQETTIGTTPTVTWSPSSLFPNWFSGTVELRLYGVNSKNISTLATQQHFVAAVPR